MVPEAKRTHADEGSSAVEAGDGHEAYDKPAADTHCPDTAPDAPETSACESQDQATTSADVPVADSVVESGAGAAPGPDGTDGALDVDKEAEHGVDDGGKQPETVCSGFCLSGYDT